MLQHLVWTVGHDRNPLIVHNARLSIPTDPLAERLARLNAVRSSDKTIEHHLEISRTEWEGSLYWAEDLGPFLPTYYATTCLYQAGTKSRDGERIRGAATALGPDLGARCPIEYKGPRNIEGMWADDNYRLVAAVSLQKRTRVTRTRARFSPWCVHFGIELDDALLNRHAFDEIAGRAGQLIGLGDKVNGLRCRFYSQITEGNLDELLKKRKLTVPWSQEKELAA
jgi:hypothetical protein